MITNGLALATTFRPVAGLGASIVGPFGCGLEFQESCVAQQSSEPETRAHAAGGATPPFTAMDGVRGAIGGVLMGLANLVPGISGGTMLLAAGVYETFIDGVAEVTTLRFHKRTILGLASIAIPAALAILLLAGVIKDLVIDHRWIMYSLFIGLTLGGVPLILGLLKPVKPQAIIGAIVGLSIMIAIELFLEPSTSTGNGYQYGLLFLCGLAGASAMVLPGISGGYILLVLGQYIVILNTISGLKDWIRGPEEGARTMAALVDLMHVCVPVGLGVLVGIVGVSNLIRLFLRRAEQPTLGVLLGLVLGSIIALWPFQQGVQPQVGDIVKQQIVTEESLPEIDAEDWPTKRFAPTPGQIAGSLGLIVVGFGITRGIARLGRDESADLSSPRSTQP